jgi:hypothetical protein
MHLQRQPGLLRCARNDELEARSRLTLGVIARLDRAIQYSRGRAVIRKSRGVLDSRLRGE